MSDGRVEFDIVGNDKDINKTIKNVTGNIQSESKKWDKAAKESTDNIESGFSSMLKKIGGAIAAAKIGQLLLNIGKDALNLASDLKEVQNVVDATFGDDAKKIEKWAKNAGTQFGLTETQAKKFTSTLGAMMKSAGMAGPEIVDMSTDLAGLAADMASFYNLDFDTAFQKIRSGISGETEPLKQLGINMSVANLNAFALAQGLEKTFDQMSQSEQIMLRYQYLMQATADAQGDFAKTSDEFANSKRRIEAAFESIKTYGGAVLYDVISPLASNMASFLEKLTREPEKTIFDKLTDINVDLSAQLEQINSTKKIADDLIASLDSLGQHGADAGMANIAEGANKLGAGTPGLWESLLSSLTSIDGLQNLFGEGADAAGNITALSNALAGADLGKDKADAWATLLGALKDNAAEVSKLTGLSEGETIAWLDEMATAANKLDPNSADGWDKLLSDLLTGLPGLADTEGGRKFIEAMATQFLAMGSESNIAAEGLKALGYETEDIAKAQTEWLLKVKELVRLIPGLSSVIDTNTGEVKGGLPALQEYVDKWAEVQRIQAEIAAYEATKKLYEEETDPAKLGAQTGFAETKAKSRLELTGMDPTQAENDLKRLKEIIKQYIQAGVAYETIMDDLNRKDYLGKDDSKSVPVFAFYGSKEDVEFIQQINTLTGEAEKAVLEYADAVYKEIDAEQSREAVLDDLTKKQEDLEEKTGQAIEDLTSQTNAAEDAAESMTLLERALSGDTEAMTEFETSLVNAQEAFAAMADYAESVRESVKASIENTVKGFNQIDYTYSEIQGKISDLTAQQAGVEFNSPEWRKLQKQIDELNAQKSSTGGMSTSLDTQLGFMDAYLDKLNTAREWGLSDELLASLSDGSVESFHYLEALIGDGKENAKKAAFEVEEKWKEVQEKKNEMTAALANQQLTVDQVYQEMMDKAMEAVDALDLGEEAEENSEKTVDGIIEGLKAKREELSSAVDAILEQMNRLYSFGISMNMGSFFFNGLSGLVPVLDGEHETGLDMVPFDGYLASLHEGEGILTAEENRIWQRFKNGGSQGIDYDTMGGVMRDNIKAGGNVYLDGQTVGRVISDMQGRSYRQLQRSGWQG